MKFALSIYFVLLIGSPAICQGVSNNNDLIANPFKLRFDEFIHRIKLHHYYSKAKLVRAVFKISHRKFLTKYKAYSQPEDIFRNGNYDCLSGTYFLSMAFDRLGINYKLIETNYHIFIIAETENGEMLLESTDRYEGIISDEEKIKEKISIYKSLNTSNKNFYLSKFQLYNELPSSKLNGLLYFNKAIESFKKNDLIECSYFLEQAWKIYDNVRIEFFAPILLKVVEQSKMSSTTKQSICLKLRAHESAANHTLALR